MFDFEYHLKTLPDKPGVYIMKNALGEVIYVGKAKVLKNRVRQYFQNSRNHSEKVRAMVKNIAEFEYIVTDSEMEALILECNLIKKHKPRYNILLKDDKSYPFIKVTIKEDFPRIFVSRNVIKDGSKYFGPYTEVSAVYETLELIKNTFPIKTCKRVVKVEDKGSVRPCLNYHIGLCKGPCAKLISKDEYSGIINDIISLLSGKSVDILKNLEVKMERAAENLEFERAAALRDKINAIKKITEKQKIITYNFENEDFISIYKDEKDVCVQVFFLREGKIIGREHFVIENSADIEDKEIIADFIKGFYVTAAFIPKSIYVEDIEEQELLEQWLTMKRGSKVWIKVPQRGDKKDTLDLVRKNAKITLEQFKIKIIQDKELYEVALRELSEILNLEDIPKRIEAYDISNIQGMDSVGSMVVFENGKAKNSDYRRFKINTVVGANDYESMREILTRRFQHGLNEIREISEKSFQVSSGKFCIFPDLILMDGGKGQVNIALEVLRSFNIDIPVCGMVKDDKHSTRGLIYNNEELPIKKHSNTIRLITRIQDEVHRFAITYHRSLRSKTTFHSILDDIPGVGERRRKELLKKFGSIEGIKKASYEEILETPAIDKKSAQNIVEFFKGKA